MIGLPSLISLNIVDGSFNNANEFTISSIISY